MLAHEVRPVTARVRIPALVRGDEMITESTTLTVSKDVVFRDLDGESVLLHLESGRYYGLDEVGSRIWTLLTKGETIAEIETQLLSEYEVEQSRLHSDIVKLLREFMNNGLVAINEDNDPQAG